MDINQALRIFDLKSLEGVSLSDIKRIYRKLAKEKHPDRQGGTSKDFVELREALVLLTKEVKHLAPIISENTVVEEAPTPTTSPVPVARGDLQTLSKDEILSKYYSETKALQLKLNTFEENYREQIEILDKVKGQVKDLVSDFDQRKLSLQKDLEKQISKLERSYSQTFVKRLLFFLPKMSEQDFWKKYNQQVDTYAKKHSELDVEFFKEMLTAYGDGLNDISKILEDL